MARPRARIERLSGGGGGEPAKGSPALRVEVVYGQPVHAIIAGVGRPEDGLHVGRPHPQLDLVVVPPRDPVVPEPQREDTAPTKGQHPGPPPPSQPPTLHPNPP